MGGLIRRLQTATAALALALLAPHAAAEARLGTDVVPVFQAVELKLDPRQADYSGVVRLELSVKRATSSFRFHARDLKLERVTLRQGGREIPVQTAAATGAQVEVTSSAPLSPGDYELEMAFTAAFGTRAVGLYRMEKDGASYAYTQFEAADARRAFPCWDEPSFKFPYALTLHVPETLEAVTNTPVENERREGGWKTIAFQKTRPLPSYLLAIAVGPFEFEAIPGLGVPGRVVTPKGQLALAAAAASETAEVLRAAEAYFGSRYPYEKLDLIAVPEYWPGAMESPGAITYSDGILLLDPKHASRRQHATLLRVTAHELAHMWFGDLVTLAWWDDLWLNESFADWMGDKLVGQLHPELGDEIEDVEQVDASMTRDALHTVGLVYGKGGAVLHMFEGFLGPETFRSAVRAYLAEHAWANADADGFWRALSGAAGRDVAGPMRSFLDQPGLPLVSAEVTGGGAALSQERFAGAGVALAPQAWQVPVSLRFSAGGKVGTRTVLLDAPMRTVALSDEPLDWVFPNADAAGYYRWRLDSDRLASLAAQARFVLSPRERVSFVANLSALLNAARIDARAYLETLGRFGDDPHPQVVSALLPALHRLRLAFVSREGDAAFAAYVRRILGPALGRLGREPRPAEDAAVALVRPQLLEWLGAHGADAAVLSWARDAASRLLSDPASVDPSLAAVAVRLAAIEGDEGLFETYRERFEAAKAPAERGRYLSALGCFRAPALRRRALDYVREGPLRANEVFVIPTHVGQSPEGREASYDWTKQNFDVFAKRIPPDFLAFMPQMAFGC